MNKFIKVWTINGTVDIKYSQFPGGEEYVKIVDTNLITYNMMVFVTVLAADSKTIMQSLMVADAIKQINPDTTVIGIFPYLPYGRQDRVCSDGESFSLKVFEELIKLRFDDVQSYDMHSKVSEDIFTDIEVPTEYISVKTKEVKALYDSIPKNSLFVSPDKGAIKRTMKMADGEIATLEKTRKDGRITQIADKYAIGLIKKAKNVVIPDDIVDGAGTFIAAAKLIKDINPNAKLYLVISHAIFSKGTSDVLKYFEDIFVIDDEFNKLHL